MAVNVLFLPGKQQEQSNYHYKNLITQLQKVV